MAYYYSGRSGDPFTDATIHEDKQCAASERDGVGARIIAEESVDEDSADWCPDCTGNSDDSDSGGDDSAGDEDGSELVDANDKSDAMLIEAGECPWCDEYSGDHVGRHASSAHPDEWTAYREGDE